MSEPTGAFKKFAVGTDEVCGIGCPAVQAGFQPSNQDDTLDVAKLYDNEVRELAGHDENVVPEPIARRAWLQALTVGRNRWGDGDPAIEAGEEVATELEWLE